MPLPPEPLLLDTHPVPKGSFLLEGKYLTETMRRHKIPFRVAQRRLPLPGGQHHLANVGLILDESYRGEVNAAMKRRAENVARNLKYKGKYAE